MGLAMASNAHADNYLQWTFQNATFSDGAKLTGSFTEDTTTAKIINFDVTTTSGTLSGFTYNPFTATTSTDDTATHSNIGWALGANAIDFANSSPGFSSPYLTLLFQNTLLSSNVSNSIVTDSGGGAPGTASYECNNCTAVRWVVSGDIFSRSVSAVPEAGEWAMMLLGLPLVGWVVRRKQAAMHIAIA